MLLELFESNLERPDLLVKGGSPQHMGSSLVFSPNILCLEAFPKSWHDTCLKNSNSRCPLATQPGFSPPPQTLRAKGSQSSSRHRSRREHHLGIGESTARPEPLHRRSVADPATRDARAACLRGPGGTSAAGTSEGDAEPPARAKRAGIHSPRAWGVRGALLRREHGRGAAEPPAIDSQGAVARAPR